MTSPSHSFMRWIATPLVALAALGSLPAAQAADVGVSIGFSQPGVYGRVDIGRYPQPVLIAPQPVVIGRPVYTEPVYLWVPPGHRRDWRRYCYQYGACGAPVYFVDDGWYRRQFIVRDRGDWHDHDDDEDDDRGRGRHRGHGRGHGHDDD